MLLAASCAELYKREATVYAPLLAPVRLGAVVGQGDVTLRGRGMPRGLVNGVCRGMPLLVQTFMLTICRCNPNRPCRHNPRHASLRRARCTRSMAPRCCPG